MGVLEQVSSATLREKNWIMSVTASLNQAMFATWWKVIVQAMKIVHHHANGCFDWLISGQQCVNPSREAISTLTGKYKTFTFVHPVCTHKKLFTNHQLHSFYRILVILFLITVDN